MTVPRRLPPYVPPPDAEARAPDVAREVDARAAARDEARPARLAALAAGPALRDLDAAADCPCGCHPRPADLDRHDGGAGCPCQQTPEERRAALDELFDTLAAWPVDDDADRVREEQMAAAAAAAGVTLRAWGGMAPFTIEGVVAGRAFYLRARHGTFTVTVAGDDDPAGDPTSWDRDRFEVAAGDDRAFDGPDGFDPLLALHAAVDAVTDFVRRRACPHVAEHEDVRFCPRCGVRLRDAHRWAADAR